MAENYVILFKDTDQTSLAANDVVNIIISTREPINNTTLDSSYLFFVKVNPPVTWDDVVWSGREENVKAWRHQY